MTRPDIPPRTSPIRTAVLVVAVYLASWSAAWAKRRTTGGPGGEDGDIAEFFWMAVFGLGALFALALIAAGAYLAIRHTIRSRAMNAIGRPNGLRFNRLVFKRGYGRKAPSFCPVCLPSIGRLVALRLEWDPPQLMVRNWWLRCPSCKGTWRG